MARTSKSDPQILSTAPSSGLTSAQTVGSSPRNHELIRSIASVITSIGVVVTAIGVCVAGYSLRLQRQVWQDYHQRARSDRAIQLLSDLAKGMGPNTRAASKLVEKLSTDELRSLHAGAAFKIKPELRSLALAAIPGAADGDLKPSADKATVQLSEAQSFALRWQIAGYLNSLEVVCEAWQRDVADQKIIEDEVIGLWDAENNQTFCRNYRDQFDGQLHYPALTSFLAKMHPPADSKTDTIGGRPQPP